MGLFEIKQRNNKEDIKNKLKKTQQQQSAKRVVSNGTGNLMDQVNKMRQVFSMYNPKHVRNVLGKDKELLQQFVMYAKANKEVAIDTETTGLDPITDRLAGVCLYTPGMDAIYIPVNHVSHISGMKVKGQISEGTLKELLNSLNDIEGIKWVFHNAKFDMRVIWWQLGIKLLPWWDTMIAARLLNENEPHGLKALWNKYINRGMEDEALKFGDLVGEGNFLFVPIDFAYKYAARDALMTYQLYNFQKSYLDGVSEVCINQGLKETSNLFRNIEMPMIEVITEMENEGVYLDLDYCQLLTAQYQEELNVINKEIEEILSEIKQTEGWKNLDYSKRSKLSDPINISSPTQLSILLYDVLGYENPLAKSVEERKKGTGADILEALNTPLTKLIIKYRGVNKLITTYTEKMPTMLNPKTHKIHANFNQIGADTGRFSSSNPNLQNIPSHNVEIRKMFIADNNVIKYLQTKDKSDLKNVFVGSDYSQQEPRILAFVSNDETLINAYLQGKDIYATVGSIVYKLPYQECLEFYPDGSVNKEGKQRRTSMKAVVLGIMYGRGESSIAENLGITVKEAENIIRDFYGAFPKVKKWVDYTMSFAKSYGYVQTVYGRKRRLTKLKYSNNLSMGEKSHLLRQAVNSVIQGSAADVTKKAMLNLYRNKKLRELGYKIVITVHDEVIGTCPYENVNEVAEEIAKVMIEAPKDRITVPMKVDVEKVVRWYGEEA